MLKHVDCEDRCQILEHKGYHTCSQTGRCEQLDNAPQEKLMNHKCEKCGTAFVSTITSWWVFAAVFVLLWIRNAMFPLKPEEYDDGK